MTAALGLYVGAWAATLPQSFYDWFPGLGLIWISVDGPYNEHLIRDVGSLYLALSAASVAATFSRTADAGRVVGVAWAVFGLPHFAYHAAHFGADVGDRRVRQHRQPRREPAAGHRADAARAAPRSPVTFGAGIRRFVTGEREDATDQKTQPNQKTQPSHNTQPKRRAT